MPRIVVIALGRILNSIGAVIAVRLYTELIGPEQVGRLSLFLALTGISTLIVIAPVSSYLMRKAIEWHDEGTLVAQLRQPLLYACLASALVAVVSVALIRAGLISGSIYVALIIGLAILGSALSSAGITLFNYLGQPFKYVALSCAMSWGGVALAGVLCWRISATAEAWLIGVTTAQLVTGVASILLIRRMPAPAPTRSAAQKASSGFSLRAISLYSAPLLMATALSWSQTDGYKYLFARLLDERTLGLFAAGIAVGLSPMLLLDRLLNDTYTPILTRAIALNGRHHWSRSWDVYASACILPLILFTMLACSGTALFARLLVSHTYYAVAWLGAFGALSKCMQMMSSLYVGFSYAALETTHLVPPYFVGALVTLGCIFFFAPLSPFVRFGASLICGGLGTLITIAWAAGRRYQIRFPIRACMRAMLFGLPIVGLNWLARSMPSRNSAFGAIGILALDTLYMAAICWIFRPKEDESIHPPDLSAVAEPEKVVQR